MAVTVVPRRNLDDNHAAVARFGRNLREAFTDWAKQPTSNTLPSLGQRLQQIAEAEFDVAFLRGKRQGLPKASLSADDLAFIRGKLQDNRSYLDSSLQPDIMAKINLQRLVGAGGGPDPARLAQVVTDAFASRIEDLYGGTLWHLQEAGFAAGVRAVAKAIRTMPRPPIAQESLLDRINRKKAEEANAFRESDFLATPETLARDQPTVDDWQQQMQDEIARKSAAKAAADDAAAADWSVDPPELAFALGLPEAELLKTITDPGFRVGTKYNCEKDARSCDPCIANSEGGEDGDGIYWEPDQAPYPGEDCDGYGNCRCTLETVYGS